VITDNHGIILTWVACYHYKLNMSEVGILRWSSDTCVLV